MNPEPSIFLPNRDARFGSLGATRPMQIPGPGHPIEIQPVAYAVAVLVDEVVSIPSLHALVMLEADCAPHAIRYA